MIFPGSLEDAFGGAQLHRELEAAFQRHKINVHYDIPISEVTFEQVHSDKGHKIDCDLLMLIPPFRGNPALRPLGITDESDYVLVDGHMRVHDMANAYAARALVAFPGPPLAHLAAGQVGRLAGDYVEGRLQIDGRMRDVMAVAAQMISTDPTAGAAGSWWRTLLRNAKSVGHHSADADARQIQFHYDVSDDFYALWLDPRRVYSCAYYRDAGMPLAQAQEAKLDHVCRKLMLREGERFLDIGAGWGGLLLWAAENYGVQAHGITLSRNQHAYVNRLIEEKKLQGRVRMELRDYRELDESHGYDKIASVGMFEHVGQVNMGLYFGKILRLLKPGGLVMNHGITAGGLDPGQLARIRNYLELRLEAFRRMIRQHVQRELERRAFRAGEKLTREVLADKPLFALTPDEVAQMKSVVAKLARRIKDALALRQRQEQKGRIDTRRTTRKSLSYGGIPMEIFLKRRHREKPKLITICDVSDSVRNASRFMLQLVWSLQECFSHVRSFVFVSEIAEVTQAFNNYPVERAIEWALKAAPVDYHCRSDFGYAFSRFANAELESLDRKTTVMILGDARNNYNDPQGWALRLIRERVKGIIWLNPEGQWGWGIGDSVMPIYAPACDFVKECRTIGQLGEVVDNLVHHWWRRGR